MFSTHRSKQNGSTSDHSIGAVVLAAGWKPYDPEKLDKKLGYGASANVITNVQFEERAKSGKITRPADGQALKTVAFHSVRRSARPAISALLFFGLLFHRA